MAAPAVIVTSAAATLFLSWSTLKAEFLNVIEKPSSAYPQWRWWLSLHVTAVSLRYAVIALLISGRMPASLNGEGAIWVRSALIFPALVGAALAALPFNFWHRWMTRSPAAFAGGLGFGAGSWFIGINPWGPWSFLRASTFWTVQKLLQLAGQPTVMNLDKVTIGTNRFSVQIMPACMGLEGVGLVAAFLALYVFIYRRTLRFPQVFVLFPIAMVLMWFLNAVRIAALILLGGWNPQLAVGGFHSVAGWLLFNATALGLVFWNQHSGFVVRDREEPRAVGVTNPAAMYLVPLLVIIATAMVSTAFSAGFNYLYPLRVLAAAGALWFYRRELASLDWKPSWWAIAPGVLTFVLWIALASGANGSADKVFSAGLGSMSALGAFAWLSFRVVGAVVTVPIAEELAFRGYLIRKLIADDFAAVPMGSFTWLSFLGSSILFGVMHGEWIAGIVAGMLFAVALYRRGAIVDAVVAHSTTNALLSVYVLATHHWFLWN